MKLQVSPPAKLDDQLNLAIAAREYLQVILKSVACRQSWMASYLSPP
jgi:hypothetical protein